ncbi:NAD/NADP octopine/nopaline dehydrogenase family protein [Thermovenabulum gondwanense]|uniref:Opine dehydrogenase n=1 Tax=Thermovenabulum gondwanense TaxID=520767 RepID=A0A162MWL3_9FIRM|nr:NAD/NADP octopine/nopaline dehydrogenase family protein [Thermovenabulum gondwanense]KYO68028.1 Opine dehydrogenase [Thermovenabulum gondwanense]
MKRKAISYAVIGAGNGGLAMAGYLGLKGYKVNLYNRSYDKLVDLIKDPIIYLTGAYEGEGRLYRVTSDIKEAIEGVDVIMVTTPATAHKELAVLMAPYLQKGQIIILNPGRTCGAFEVLEILKKNEADEGIIVAEAQTFIYACRALSSNRVKIFSVKNEVKLAAIPSEKTEKVIRTISDAFPQFKKAADVLETSLNNFGAIFHPAPTLLNSGHIERCQPFEYYLEGITPTIGKVLERLDEERIRVAKALGVKTLSAIEWLFESYGATGDTLYEAIQNNTAYKGLTAPKGLNTRYIYEDVPYSLVPISSLGKELGVETPAIDTIIGLACMMTGVNFWEEGRTSEKLGLAGLTPAEIHLFAQKGYILKKSLEEEVVA